MPIHDFHEQNNSFHRNSIRIRWKHRHRFYNYRCGNQSFRLLKNGYWMVPSSLKVLAKFGFCSNCSQKLDECSLAHTCKTFASARMLGFSFKFAAVQRKRSLHLKNKNWPWKNASLVGNWQTLGEHACAMNVQFWKNASLFSRRLLKLSHLSSVPSSRVTLPETIL